MTDEEFARFHKEKYCSPTAYLEGRVRIQVLEELATAILAWKDRPRWSGDWPKLNRIMRVIVRDNERVERLRERYDKAHAKGKKQLRAKTLFPKKT